MNKLTEDERRLGERVIHQAFVDAEFNGEDERAEILKSLRDKLDNE